MARGCEVFGCPSFVVFQDGDEIGFIYLGDPAAELSAFLAKR